MKATKIITMLVACSLCAGTAMANGPVHKGHKPPPPVDEFKILDKNHDGKLSKEEFLADKGAPAEAFARLDKNNDGFLDRYEFSLRAKKH